MVEDKTATPPRGWMQEGSPFHEGEIQVQARLGVRERMEGIGRKVIRDHMPDQHRTFYQQLPWIFIGAVDDLGQPWASVITGEPGFISSPEPTSLHIHSTLIENDPLTVSLQAGRPVGLLGIELPTRRRNRVNGHITQVTSEGLQISVTQSFGNCPKYIQARSAEGDRPEINQVASPILAEHLLPHDRELIANADTFFVASYSGSSRGASAGVDVSHRGGKPGFVRVDDDGTLTVPDFVGNSFYNTIGNLMTAPQAGLLFPDLQTGDLLYLAVTAEVVWEGPEVDAFLGAQRLLRFRVKRTVRLNGALRAKWQDPELSPFLTKTGEWLRQS